MKRIQIQDFSTFQQSVWEIVRLIPKGRVSTYGAVAKALGFPNHARHVGRAMRGSPEDVPAHRLIASMGRIPVPGFTQKLEAEGIEVSHLHVKNFKEVFWDPMKEL